MTGQLENWRGLAAANPALAGKALQEVRSRLLRPHGGGQVEVLSNRARFRVVRAGRRWGKTKIAARETIREAITNPGTVNWWIANRWRNTRRGYRNILKQLPPSLLAKPAPSETANELTLHLRNGSSIEFYSAESPDSLAGEGVWFVVYDEAALTKEGVWSQLIRPTLMDTGGSAMLISTPRGKNWFYDLWWRGQDPAFEDHASWHFPQWTNPYIPAAETEAARHELPSLVFAQEIAAEFVSNAASIFRAPEGAVLAGTDDPDGLVIFGVDWAKKEDFTVITGANAETRRPCYHQRFNDLSWPVQKRALLDAVDYVLANGAEHVAVYVDATGGSVGDVMLDELLETGLDVQGIDFSNQWKVQAVKLLAKDLEQENAYILEAQREEFESYEYELTASGNWKFAAARGHDDEVAAKLLEHWGLVREGSPDIHEVRWTDADAEEEALVEEETTPIVADDPGAIMARPDAWD